MSAPLLYETCTSITGATYWAGSLFIGGYLDTNATCARYCPHNAITIKIWSVNSNLRSAGGRCTAYDVPNLDIFYNETECAAQAAIRGKCLLSNCTTCDKVCDFERFLQQRH